MNRLFRLTLLPSVLLAAIVTAAVAQPPAQPVVYGRGHVDSPNLAAMQATSAATQADFRQEPPRATEPKFDSSDLLGAIKNQASCGSCWDFAGTGTIEGAFAKRGVKVVLSEQFTLDCVRSGGCNGDDYSTVYKNARARGIPTTDEYGPYKGGPSRCHSDDGMKFYKIKSWDFVDPQRQVADTQKIKDYLKAYGPIGSAVGAGNAWNSYRGGVYRGHGYRINHEVIVVGWDDTLSAGKTVWKVRNSWTESFGDKGHIWMVEGADGIGTQATYVVADAPEPPPPSPPVPPVPVHPFDWFAFVFGVVAGLAIAIVVVFVVSRRKA